MNGFYIPLLNTKGELIFTPDEYDMLHENMAGISYYNTENEYKFSDKLDSFDINNTGYEIDIESSIKEVNEKSRQMSIPVRVGVIFTAIALLASGAYGAYFFVGYKTLWYLCDSPPATMYSGKGKQQILNEEDTIMIYEILMFFGIHVKRYITCPSNRWLYRIKGQPR